MPTFSWTQYSFEASNQPLTPEGWIALRSTSAADHKRIIESMKKERWDLFWQEHGYGKWFLWAFAGGLVCISIGNDVVRGIGAIVTLLTSIGCFGILMTASSHAVALSKRCHYFRTQFKKAASAESYEAYLQGCT